jgi:hypothetical protein
MTRGRRDDSLEKEAAREDTDALTVPTPAEKGRYLIAVDEARRGFDEQAEQLGRIRSMMGSLLGYSGVAVSVVGALYGGIAAPSDLSEAAVRVAVAAFIANAFVVAAALWTVKFVPGIKARELVSWADGGASADAIARDVALRTEEALERNRGYMKPLAVLQPCSVVLFGITVVALAVRLIGA